MCFSARAAEEFGDISVSASAIYSGATFHGYSEIRVALGNRSPGKAHVVTLTFPNQAWHNGNSIGRLARTLKLAPGAREIVALLQPPLPANGDNNIRVEVDGHREGEVRAANVNNHCNDNSGRGAKATVFISRSLNFDEFDRLFHANQTAFTAAMATGVPDASGYGRQAAAWMPDTGSYGVTNWLELDYAPPLIANKLVIYSPQNPTTLGSFTLIGNSGAVLGHVFPSPTLRPGSTGRGWKMEYALAQTSEPVKTVRFDFGKMPPGNLAIDAVEISGPGGSAYAADARASSDNSAAAARYSPGGTIETVVSLRAESPVTEWSENWLAYSPFDAIALSAADLAAMPPAVMEAVGNYLQAGGNVVLSGQATLPAAWRSTLKKNLADGVENNVGFGRCFALRSGSATALDSKSVQTLRDAVREASLYWQGLPHDGAGANATMPVVENLKMPTRGIVVIMLAFIIIIGPVNIFYLNRRQRRTWMLWTIPAISFATTLLVFAYSLLREGITPDTRIAGLTLLDQAGHHATTIGATAFYCPLTPSAGLHFDYETEATPLVQTGWGPGSSREVDWSQSQHFSRGWVSARVPVHFHLRKSETRRERIQVIKDKGLLQIVNGLGAPIKSLWIADGAMNIYEAASIAAGQKALLMPATLQSGGEQSGANGLLREISYVARLESLGSNASRFLTPNSYVAVLEGNPFIENALGTAARAKRTRASAVVYGILESDK